MEENKSEAMSGRRESRLDAGEAMMGGRRVESIRDGRGGGRGGGLLSCKVGHERRTTNNVHMYNYLFSIQVQDVCVNSYLHQMDKYILPRLMYREEGVERGR